MWKLKGCPRCKGDMLVDRDFDGWYQSCLQCGYRGDLYSTIETLEQHAEKKTTGANPVTLAAGHEISVP